MSGGSAGRRRHGRIRRWMVRPFFWGVAVLAVLFVGALAYLESDDFERRFGEYALGWLEERLGRRVDVRSLDLELFPFAIEATGVVIDGAAPGSLPFGEADRVVVEATVGSLVSPGVTVDRVLVDRPRVRIQFDADGTHDAPRWNRRRTGAPAESRLVTEIGHLEVIDGLIEIQHDRYPLDFSAERVAAELVGGRGLELRGRASASDVEVRLPNAFPYRGAVDVDATFQRGRVDVRQAAITGPDLSATASGIWTWGEQSDVDMRIVADTSIEMLDRLGYLVGFGQGALRLETNLRRKPGEWFLDGTFIAPAARILDRQVAALSGEVFGDQRGLRFAIGSGRYGGGRLSGEVLVSLAESGPQPVDVDLRLEGVRLERLLADQGIPVGELAATATGRFAYRFPRDRPRKGDGVADLVIAASNVSEATGLQVAGRAPLSIVNGSVRTTGVRLTSESQRFLVDGSYSLEQSTGEFGISIASERVDELFPALGIVGEPALWQPLQGSGVVEGDVEIAPDGVSTTVRVDVADVRAQGYTADRVRGGFRLTTRGVEDLNLELIRPTAAMIVSGSAPLDESSPSSTPFQLSIESEGWAVRDFRPWLPVDPRLDGAFSGGISLEGSVASPRGVAFGRVRDVRLGRFEAPELAFATRFDAESMRIEDSSLEIAGGAIDCAGDIGFDTGSLDIRCGSGALDLAALPGFSDLPGEVTGSAEIRARLSGTVEDPALSTSLEGTDVGIVGRAAGASVLQIDWRQGELDIEGSIGPILRLEGGGRLDREAADLAIGVSTNYLDDVLALAGAGLGDEFGGEASGALEIRYAGDPGTEAEIVLRIDELGLRNGDVLLSNLEPVVLAFEPEGVEIRSLFLTDERGESEAFAAGRIGAGDLPSVDLNVQATLAAHWLQPAVPGIDLRGGTFQAIGRVSGTVDDLRINGQGELRRGRALVDGFPSSFENVGALILFYPERVVVEQGRADVAGGVLKADGAVDVPREGRASYRFQVGGEGLSVRYPEGWLLRGGTELTVASVDGGRRISGVARLDSARYLEDVQFLRSLFGRRRLEEGDVEPWRSETSLDLVVDLPDGLEIRNNVATLNGSAELVVRGSLARPVVFGRVDLQPNGELIYSGQEYTVERGSLNFTNPYRIEPILDLVATTELREYDVTLTLAGTPDRLQADFASSPPLAELEVLALLTGGSDATTSEVSDLAEGGGSVAAERFLYSQATSLIAGRFNRLFGLDELRIDPLTSSTGDLSSARITVGKQLSRDLHVTYAYDPVQSEEQILELEWSVSRSLLLVLTQNGDGSYAVDARWEKAL